MSAFDMIRSNVGTTQPYYSSALDTSQRLQNSTIAPQQATAAQFAGTDLSPYMNPYTNEVINASLGDIAAQRLEQQQRLKSEAQAADAFGNSRYGVMLGQYEADTLRDQGNLAAQLRNQGFNTAADLAMQDISARNSFGLQNQALDFQGQVATADMQNRNAFLTGILGDRMGAANAQDAEALGRVGSAQDARTQQQLDVNYGNYWDQNRAYPSQQLNWWSSALQPGIGTAGAGTPPQSGGLLGTLGGAQLGAQVGNSAYDWWKGMTPSGYNGINPADYPINVSSGLDDAFLAQQTPFSPRF
jgi:hypothetical protein